MYAIRKPFFTVVEPKAAPPQAPVRSPVVPFPVRHVVPLPVNQRGTLKGQRHCAVVSSYDVEGTPDIMQLLQDAMNEDVKGGQGAIESSAVDTEVPSLDLGTPSVEVPTVPETPIDNPPEPVLPELPSVDTSTPAVVDSSTAVEGMQSTTPPTVDASDLVNNAQSSTDAVMGAAQDAVENVQQASGSIPGSQETVEKVQEVSGITFGVPEGADQVQQAATEKLQAAQDAASQAADLARQSASDASEAVGDALNTAGSTVTATLDSVSSTIGSTYQAASESVDKVLGSLQDTATASVTQAQETIDALAQQVGDSLPPEVKEAASVIAPPVKSVLSNPPLLAGILGSLGALYGYSYYTERIAGYSGDVSPESALDILQNDYPALLIDIRSDADRANSGIPLLKRNALGKGASVPISRLPKTVSKMVNDQKGIEAGMTAAYIGGLMQATYSTQYIIMGESDKEAREVARALRSLEFGNTYVMAGGFESWATANLPVNSNPGATYEAGTLDVISDRAESIVDKTATLKDPAVGVPTALGVGLCVWALVNYHYTLKLVGVSAPLAAAVVFLLNRYDSPEEFLEEAGDVASSGFGSVSELAGSALSEARSKRSVESREPEDVFLSDLDTESSSVDSDVETVLKSASESVTEGVIEGVNEAQEEGSSGGDGEALNAQGTA